MYVIVPLCQEYMKFLLLNYQPIHIETMIVLRSKGVFQALWKISIPKCHQSFSDSTWQRCYCDQNLHSETRTLKISNTYLKRDGDVHLYIKGKGKMRKMCSSFSTSVLYMSSYIMCGDFKRLHTSKFTSFHSFNKEFKQFLFTVNDENQLWWNTVVDVLWWLEWCFLLACDDSVTWTFPHGFTDWFTRLLVRSLWRSSLQHQHDSPFKNG